MELENKTVKKYIFVTHCHFNVAFIYNKFLYLSMEYSIRKNE